MSKIFRRQDPVPHLNRRGRKKGGEREGRGGEWSIPQIKFYVYSSA
jgi:hypothetical protein